MNKTRILALLTNPFLVRLVTFFRPHRFVLRFYLSSFFKSLGSSSGSTLVNVANGYGVNLKMALQVTGKSHPLETFYWLGFGELAIQRQFAKVIKKSFIVYDIGAYIGFHSLIAGRLAGPLGKVYCFEPFPKNNERLKLHILLNKMQDRVFCIPKAVTDKAGKAICHYRGHDTMYYFTNIDCSGEYNSAIGGPVVETISLDEFIFQEGHPAPNLIKIDVEGGELKVLLGAQRLLREFKPSIICEIHSIELARQVYEELKRLGYRFKVLNEKGMPFNLHYGHILAQAAK